MATIYDLTYDFLELLNLFENGEIDEEVLNDTLESVQGELDDKLQGYGKVRLELLASIEKLKNEEERLYSKRKPLENNVKKLEEVINKTMQTIGKSKIKTDLFTFTIAKNPPSLEVLDIEKVPSEFLIDQAPKVDSKALKEHLKTHELECAKLIQKESLRIK